MEDPAVKRTVTVALFTLGLAGLARCSGSDATTPTTFACGTIRCNPMVEYCQDSAHPGGAHDYACQALSSSCTGDPCSSCLSGLPGRVSCTTNTNGIPGTVVVIAQ